MNVWPAIETVPLRAASGFAPITSCTEPLPDPLLPDETAIQLALLEVVHEQPAGAVTLTDALSPPLLMFWLAGEIEYEHPTA